MIHMTRRSLLVIFLLAPMVVALRDDGQFEHVGQMLGIQAAEARCGKDACLLYYQTFSRMPFPEGVEQPLHSLEYYRGLRFHYVPGI